MSNGKTPVDPIEHVLVLALENRSFDHMLGALQAVKPGIDGIPAGAAPRTNSYAGRDYPQAPGAGRIVVEDPRHETPHVLSQLQIDAAGNPTNAGFVADYATYYYMLDDDGRGQVMTHHERGTLPALHALAEGFTVCDRWFSSVPGPTWANRLFLMSGTSLGHVSMPGGLMDLNLHWYDQTTLFDRLDERGKSWAVYHGDTPLSLLLVHQWEPKNLERYRPMPRFFADAAGDERNFPAFAFIEPAYLDPGANDDHPSHDVLAGEALIASVYNALRANEALWSKSLLVVLFDEHGGFYDHVPPPPAVPPDHHQHGYTFDRLGVRVPAILVSPFAPNDVCKETMDHTSLLKYLIDKWGLGPLGARAAEARTFKDALTATARRDAPLTIPAVPRLLSPVAPPPHQPLNDHQSALVALSHALESMAGEDPLLVAARSRQVITGPQSQIDAAVDRVEAFLSRAKDLAIKTIAGA
jgi:phospholipase C